MEPTISAVLARVHLAYAGADAQTVDGFFPGPTYSPFTSISVHGDHPAHGALLLRRAALRSSVEEFLRLQYPDGSISATIGPDFKVDKATVVSDEETSTIVDRHRSLRRHARPSMAQAVFARQTLIERLNAAMLWVLTQRRDPDTRLIRRAHTTDWGDIKWEPTADPSHMRPGDQWTESIYDQAIAYAALQGLARLNAAAGRDQDSARWQGEANELRASTNVALWQEDSAHGFYRIHKHSAPDTIHHDFVEDDVVAIGNAAAIYYGLAEADKVPRILSALNERGWRQARRSLG